MELTEEIMQAITASPVFAEMTERYNEYARECNAAGKYITPYQREQLQRVRILVTLKDDADVRKMYAGYLWEQLRNEETPAA